MNSEKKLNEWLDSLPAVAKWAVIIILLIGFLIVMNLIGYGGSGSN